MEDVLNIVTACGFFHLQSDEPLFCQLVALGGSPLVQPLPLQVAEIAYGIVTSVLGLDKLSPAEQVEALLAIPAEELSAKLAGVPFPVAAVVDGDIVKSSPSVCPRFHLLRSLMLGHEKFTHNYSISSLEKY